MLVVRPVELDDLDQLYKLSDLAEVGLTSLPHDRVMLAAKIKQSVRSFSLMPDRPGGEMYLLVIEDLDRKVIAGTSAIYSKVGGFEPFYTYKIKTIRKESKILNVKREIQYLELVKDHNGPSEIGTLFLNPGYRRHGNGRLLSLSRFLFMAQYPQCFEDDVIAEMRGVIDKNDRSPFWEALGKHFFAVEFKNADMMVLRDKSFIADLMPMHPIYLPLLPAKAQKVLGQVHENTRPALHFLETEGFIFKDEIDIFEAGPVVKAKRRNIRTVQKSREGVVTSTSRQPLEAELFMIANVNDFKKFRVVIGSLRETDTGVHITQDVARVLKIKKQGKVRYVPLRSGN